MGEGALKSASLVSRSVEPLPHFASQSKAFVSALRKQFVITDV